MKMTSVLQRPPLNRWLQLGQREVGLVAAIVLIAGMLWGFAEIADAVLEGETHAFDRAVLLALRNPVDRSDPIGPAWLQIMAADLTSLGGTTVLTLIALAVVGYLLIIRKRGAAVLVVASIGGGTLLSMFLKLGFERPRPDLVPHLVPVHTASFPSGHAMLAAVTYLTLGALLARVQPQRRVKTYFLALAVMLTLLIGGSRVYLGVHWPTDVMAGWCIGAAWALLCWLVALWLQSRGRVERTGPPTDE